MPLEPLLQQLDWRVVHQETWPARAARYAPLPQDFPARLRSAVEARFPQGLYAHQAVALQAFLEGHHVALTTGTASGKSLVFYLAALHLLHQEPTGAIAVLYPLKALGREQEHRWRDWLERAGLSADLVQRIDGDVDSRRREALLQQARVLLFTPDVVHAWLLPNGDKPEVVAFLQRLRLVVVDEVHTYSGVFGSNAAFLFRRWQHLMHLAGNEQTRWMTASATLREPRQFLHQLFGLNFAVFDESHDGSPQHPLRILMVEPPEGDRFAALARLLHELVQRTPHRFLAFADSRKQVEFLGTLVRRLRPRPSEEDPTEDPDDAEEGGRAWARRVQEVLTQADILPYRAGLEFADRALIQQRLSQGALRGVISTSALELGIDIGHLDVAVLVGVPPTMTSLQQRIGRVGRRGPGEVLIVNSGSPQDEALFRTPREALHRPPAESTLYLENPYLQYIHALCLARPDEGEHDLLRKALGQTSNGDGFTSPIAWPEGFLRLCNEERTGQVPRELQNWASSAQNQRPQWVYPLRDIEPQFTVVQRLRGQEEKRGSLSYYQVLNEAYPGAVYYYASVPFRVQRVFPRTRRIEVRPEKAYRTRAKKYTWLQPSLRPEAVRRGYAWGALTVLETELQIRERVTGYDEWRGSNHFEAKYPNEYWDFHSFERGYFSTGLVFTHPALNDQSRVQDLAEALYEAFLLTVPVDRREIGWATGLMPLGREPFFPKGQRFIALYERVYGGLHLTGKVLDDLPDRLLAMLEATASFAPDPLTLALRQESVPPALFRRWLQAIRQHAPQTVRLDPLLPPNTSQEGERVRIIVPGSRGTVVRAAQHRDVRIQSVFYHPTHGLMYIAVPCDLFVYEPPQRNTESRFPVAEVHPIPGVSCMGWYDVETGAIVADPDPDCRADDDCWTPDEAR